MVFLKNLKELAAYITPRRKGELLALLFLTFVGAGAEMATLGAVVPFLAVIAEPNGIENKLPWLHEAVAWSGFAQGRAVIYAASLFGLVATVAGLLRIFIMWVSLRVSYGLGADISCRVYSTTLYRPYAWHASHNSSEILASLEKTDAVTKGVIIPLLQGSAALLTCLGIVGMLLLIDPVAALIAGVCFSVFYIITIFIFRRYLVSNGSIVSASISQRIKVMQEGIGGIRDILLDGTQSVFIKEFVAVDRSMRSGQTAIGLIGVCPRYIIEAAGMLLIVAIAIWMTDERAGNFTAAIPVLGVLAIGAQKLLPQMQLVYHSWSTFNGNQRQLQDVIDLINEPEERLPIANSKSPDFAPSCVNLNEDVPVIAAKNISFNYKSNGTMVLKNVVFDIKRYSQIGFVGSTGSGKSTLIDLLMGLLDPIEGSIEIDGKPLTKQNVRQWQNRIAHVPQSIYLADASIAENIAFGVSLDRIDMERVREAARKAQLSSFIEALPYKYEEIVGERGVRLSGGQRQRIGLARAFYKKAEVLILDEATSALDGATEESVIDSIVGNRGELTVLMIAHRISTLSRCDLIIELNNGTVSKISAP